MMTIRDRADALGLESYDTALPLRWTERVEGILTYLNVRCYGNFVWCYDDYPNGNTNISGYPVAVTETGRAILGSLAMYATGGR